MENEGIQEKTSEIKPARDENGRLLPGNTANPNGRPKGSFSLVEMIKNKLQEIPEGEKRTYAEVFIDKLFEKTNKEGDANMMRDMINRVDGMAKQAIDHTTQGEKIMFLPMEILEKNGIETEKTTD